MCDDRYLPEEPAPARGPVEPEAGAIARRYRALLDVGGQGVVEVDANHRITFANRTMAEMVGYTLDETLGRPITDFIPADSHDFVTARFAERKEGRHDTYELSLRRKDGTSLWVEVSSTPILDEARAFVGSLSVVKDISARRHAEDTLRESEARYRSLFENDHTIMWLIDPETVSLADANPAACAFYGYTREQLVAMPLWHINRLSEEQIRQAMRAANQGECSRFLFQHVLADGRVRDVEVYSGPIRIGGRDLLYSVIHDVTDRIRAEQALRESEAQYRLFFQGNPMPMWVYDRETLYYLAVNDAAVHVFGYGVDEFLGMRIVDQLVEEQRPGLRRHVAGVAGERRLSGPWTFVTKDGRHIEAEATAHTVQWNGRSARLVLMNDVTEKLRADRELRHTMAAFEAIVQNAPVAIVVVSPDRAVRLWNQGAERMFGWSAAEIVGKPYPIVPPEKEDEFQVALATVTAGTAILGRETQRLRRDGTPVDVTMFIAPIPPEVAGLSSAVVIMVDMTEHKQLEARFMQAQKLEGVGRLAGGVAHDFNNILTAIMGYTEMATALSSGDEKVVTYLGQVRKAAERAASLTLQLLAFARKQVVEPKIVSINDLITGVDPMLRRLIGEDIELVTLTRADAGNVLIDPGQFEQVLVNMAVNARDAMPHGGKLTIETRSVVVDDDSAAERDGMSPGEFVVVSVSDTGVGMGAEVRSRVFEPFYTTKEPGKGTGLGLATCYGIVKQAGGHIWVYSEEGQGSTFRIYLPRIHEAEDGRTAAAAVSASLRGTERLLVAEDEPMVRRIAVETLQQNGYLVIEAASGGEALLRSLECAEPIDLLVTDVVMPQMSGPILAERMQELRPGIKVLYASGYTDSTIIERGVLGAGAAFLQKPYSPVALLRKVREVLDGRR